MSDEAPLPTNAVALAELMLAKDLANIAAKVQSGGTLTSSERLLFEKMRRPAPVAPPPPAVHEPVAQSPEPFTLTSASGRIRDQYRHPLPHYGEIYGFPSADGRTIKRWVKHGKSQKPTCLPPLDDPSAMPAWWSTSGWSSRPVPESIRLAAEALRDKPGDSAKPLENFSQAQPVIEPIRPPDAAARDFPAQVAALRTITDAHLAAVERAGAAVPPVGLDPTTLEQWAAAKALRVDSAQRTYKGTLEILRKAENDLLEWQQAHRELVPRAPVATEIATVISAIHSAVKRLLRTLRPKLEGKLPFEQDRLWDAETRDCFRTLANAKFIEAP